MNCERLYRALYRIRRVEEEVARVYPTDRIQSPVHLSIGQEAVAVGVCEALAPDDVVFGTYRSHAFYLAKGGNLKRMIAELYGKATGVARGKGGSMHLIDIDQGVMGTSAVVATGIPHAVGYADELKRQRRPAVVACFFGDGAVEEGVFHESMNLAALRKVPALFVCENNRYAIHSEQRARQAFPAIAQLAAAYGIPTERIEDGDVMAIHGAARRAVDAMRAAGGGPRFIECMTYRWRAHVGPNEDFTLGYRLEADAQPWRANDQVRKVGELLDAATREAIVRDVEAEIAEAFRFAEDSPSPVPADLYADLYREG